LLINGLKISLTICLIWAGLFFTGFIILGLFYLVKRMAVWYCKMQYRDQPEKLNNILNKILEDKK
jgi:uncharacterized membrane protein YciS (DUF1049 family)